MNLVPIYQVLRESVDVTALLGEHPALRVYAFGKAPQGVARPYLVWQEITGAPGNTLGCKPEYDEKGIQIDIYADTDVSARDVRKVVAERIEEVTYVTAWQGEGRDRETGYYRVTFSADWFVPR